MVMIPDSESVGSEFKYSNFIFLERKSSLISLILNTKSQKHDCKCLIARDGYKNGDIDDTEIEEFNNLIVLMQKRISTELKNNQFA